jgi:hypothetical protein
MTELLGPSNLVSIFDAALMWFDKDPHESFSGYGLHGWIIPLTRDRQVRDLVHDLLSEIESGRMQALRSGQLQGIPQSWKVTLGDLPGNRDPRYTMVPAQALAELAAKRGEKPEFLAHLMDDLSNAKPEVPSVSGDQPTTLELRPAPRDKINAAISAVYDDAEAAKKKAPNTKEIVRPVKDRLATQGFEASGRFIQELANAPIHKKRRRKPGATIASEKRRPRQ